MSQQINSKTLLYRRNILSFYFFVFAIVFSVILFCYLPLQPEVILKNFSFLYTFFSLRWYFEVFASLYGTGLILLPLLFFWHAFNIFYVSFHFWIVGIVASLFFMVIGSSLCCFYKIHNFFPGFLAGGLLGNSFVSIVSSFDILMMKIILYTFFCIFLLGTVQRKGIYLLYTLLKKLFQYSQLQTITLFLYHILLSWIIFIIPKTKKIFNIQSPYNIQDLINKSIQDDLSYINQQYSIQYNDVFIDKNETVIESQNNYTYDNETQLLKKHLELPLSLVKIFYGPVINTIVYYIPLEMKMSVILSNKNEIARIFGNYSTRINYPVKDFNNCIAIEVPNNNHYPLSSIYYIQKYEYLLHQSNMEIPFILGIDARGEVKIADLAKFPHAIIAGTTGSGKSSLLHAILMSLLWNNYCNQEIEIFLFDPKRVEFFNYHSLSSCIKKVSYLCEEMCVILLELIEEMERRYNLFTKNRVKNIHDYKKFNATPLPYIVVIIDEFADLSFAEQGDKIIHALTRLSQMSRAAGIHIIMATQRPSAQIITGSIKANFPTKIACRVTSALESRIILDCDGAERLLGMGDMLVALTGKEIERIQSLYVDDMVEIEKIVTIFKQKQKNKVVE